MNRRSPIDCPGLDRTPAGTFWKNSVGQVFDLSTERTLTAGEVALYWRRSTEHVLRLVRRRELYPVLRLNKRNVEIFEAGVRDFRLRQLNKGAAQ